MEADLHDPKRASFQREVDLVNHPPITAAVDAVVPLLGTEMPVFVANPNPNENQTVGGEVIITHPVMRVYRVGTHEVPIFRIDQDDLIDPAGHIDQVDPHYLTCLTRVDRLPRIYFD